ncbi:LLM class flavin-dependent oxidoreductase [Bosea sp. BIWAKO-01]|uniref:LLM class flavin-dependent oxidoreductase n=1 Tax=Bosea sp. BIWAKO-01 TaxID=506668 RepID=UPI0008539B40|nr:LLM class flavin-dependent oxidoreductase [Bosea sp. BIWAKO-01]GAU80124.1 nitrilotriacetate monooxygenase component A [Bosea sp. BIWAKO-01]
MTRELHLNLFINGRGHHEAAWRHDGSTQRALTDVSYYRDLALAAEAAKLDSVFFADHVALGDELEHAARGELEPLTLLGALSALTERIGLIATASTTYSEPYNLARQLASLDHLSGGRIGWNIVTSWAPAAAGNFGQERQAGIDQRYERAHEFVEVASKLWDSWAQDAIIDDRETGHFARPDRIRRADHRGTHFGVAGALNIPRSPQGRPVFVQAGASTDGRAFAARYAEAIFTAHLTKESAIAFYSDIKTQARVLGRRGDQIVILPGISAAIGSTEAEARRVWEELNELSHPTVGLSRLSNRFGGHDFSHLKLDQVLSVEDFPDPSQVQASRSRAQAITALVGRERPTLRGLLHSLAGARGHFTATGTPEQIADVIEDWFVSGAADGFNVMPPILPSQFSLFTSEVVPLLQKRGLFRTEYGEGSLRQRLGLDPVPSQFDQQEPLQKTA